MTYIIREMKQSEYPLLDDFLYEAIFLHDNEAPPPKDIINRPELQVYIKDFGTKKDDYCLCAEYNSKIVGAVWVRNIKGYGSIDSEAPEFAVSVYKDFRGHGIGTSLMHNMLIYLRNAGYKKASLAVQKDNYACKMYISLGFKIIDENTEEYIMIHNLNI